VAIREYLSTHQVFTRAQFARAFPDSVTDRNLLARAMRSGGVDRVRRGVYVSKTGQYAHTEADPFDVAVAVSADAVFCYLSALELYGTVHNVVTVILFYANHRIAAFEYAGRTYRPRHLPAHRVHTQALLRASGRRYQVTSKEQTLIDCLARPALAGGYENLLRSLSGLTYVDFARLHRLSAVVSDSTCAKLGWVLEVKRDEWGIDASLMEHLGGRIGGGPYYFWSSRPPKDSHWVNRWRLYLPHCEQEMAAWLNQ
jgi:predicted transcriptional regulator of viral defense system